MIIVTQLLSNKSLTLFLSSMLYIFISIKNLNASTCKKVSESIYNLKPINIHRLCLMNEFSETPAHFVDACKKNPTNFFFRNKKIRFSEIENEVLCTDKYILNTCKVDKGFLNGPKFLECIKVENKYRGQKF